MAHPKQKRWSTTIQISFLTLYALSGTVGAVDFDPFESGSPSSPLSYPQLESEGPIIPDIQFTNSDISMAFQIISDATGWSIFSTEQAGRAKVSLWAKDIRAKELLDRVVELAGFVYHRRGDTISVMTYDEYLQYHGLAKRTFGLAHADATSVAAAIKPFLTKLGKSTVHKETNTIVLYETDASLDSIAAVVQKLDTPAEDIEIEIVNLKCAECDSLAAVLQQIFARQIALPRNKTAPPRHKAGP